uniref:Uncharacterized protein n=1 Tax=Ciona savignyi TaxID=51511 RepID=H2YNE4_CIOSA
MEEKAGTVPQDPAVLKEFHAECLAIAKENFDKLNAFDTEAEQKTRLRFMEWNIGIRFNSLSSDNETKIAKTSMFIIDQVYAAGNIYFEEMEKIADGQYMEDVSGAGETAEAAANAAFEESTQDIDEHWVNEHRQALKTELDSKKKEFIKYNKEMEKNRKTAEKKQKFLRFMNKSVRMGNVDLDQTKDSSILTEWANKGKSLFGIDSQEQKDFQLLHEQWIREKLGMFYTMLKSDYFKIIGE